MRTTRFSGSWVFSQRPQFHRDPISQRPPFHRDPPCYRDPLFTGIPRTQTPQTDPPGQSPPRRTMGPGTWDQAAKQEITSHRDPYCGQTNTCENITLPQTSFAGGNKRQTKKLSLNFEAKVRPTEVNSVNCLHESNPVTTMTIRSFTWWTHFPWDIVFVFVKSCGAERKGLKNVVKPHGVSLFLFKSS